MRLLIGLCLVVFIGFESCKEDEKTTIIEATDASILVVNEGNFNLGNASIGMFDQSYALQSNVFEKANGRKIGDVLQDVVRFGDYIYIVVNNSGKIERLNKTTLVSERYNDGFTSPRKICFFDDSRAYVSDLYNDALYEIDPTSLEIKKEIACSGWTEDMIHLNNQVFVVNVERERLLVYSPNLNAFVDSIELPKMPGNMLVDKENNLWVYCAGETNKSAQLLKLSTQPLKLLNTITLNPLKEFYPRLAINADKDELYILNGGVYRLNINSTHLGDPIIIGQGKTFYGLGINKINNDILLSEIVGFNLPSLVHIYDSIGQEKKMNVKSGIITSAFVN